MELKFVIPKMKETFGELEFAGLKAEETKRMGNHQVVTSRTYSLFSSNQRADNIEVIVAGSAGEKQFEFEDKVKLVNPRITAEGKNIAGYGHADYKLYADDIMAAENVKNNYGHVQSGKEAAPSAEKQQNMTTKK